MPPTGSPAGFCGGKLEGGGGSLFQPALVRHMILITDFLFNNDSN